MADEINVELVDDTAISVELGETGPQGLPGVGVPTGGTSGQILTKQSGTDYDADWESPESVSIPDATASVKGALKLTGDLGGTSSSPAIKRNHRFLVAPFGDTRPADYTCATQYSNQTEINQAIIAANALAQGGTVELLDGDFYVSSAIIPLDNVTIKGQGMFQTKIGVQPSLNSAFTIIDNFSAHDGDTEPNSIRWSIKDLEVDGSNFNDAFDGKGIFSIKVQECNIERVYVHHTTATGIGVDDFIRTSLHDCFVEFCGYKNKKYIVGASYSTGPNRFTYTTSAAHGYSVGDTVVITGLYPRAYNGVYLVSTTPTSTSFAIDTSNNSDPTLTFDPGVCNAGTTATITAASWSGRFTTYTTTAAHGLNIGDLVYVSGMSPSSYNGYYPVARVPSTTTFAVNMYRTPGTATGFGTVNIAGISSDYAIGHSGIGVATGAATAEAGLIHHNFTRYNQNNNIFYETNNAISGTATFKDQALQITNNISVAAGQSGLRNTGALNVQINNNYDYGSYIGIRVSGFTLTRTITAASWSTNIATFTTSSAHSYAVGDPVLIYGMSPSGYNGNYVIASIPSTTQFTVALTSDPGAATVFGSSKANVHPVWGTQIHDNIVENSVLYAFYQETFCDRISVQGNQFKNSYLIGAYLTSSNTQFIGNIISDSGQYGLQLISGGSGNLPIDNVLVSNNYIRNSGQRQSSTYDGVYVQPDTTNTNAITSLRIVSNHIYDDQITKTQRYGVVLKSGGILTDTTVSNNDLGGNATAGLLIQNAGLSSIEAFNNVGVNPESRYDMGTTSGSLTFDRSVAKVFKVIANGNITATMPASIDGAVMIWIIQQDATSGRTLTLPGNAASQETLALSNSANAIDIIEWIYDLNTTKWRVVSQSLTKQGTQNMVDGANFAFGATTGTKIGTSTAQKLAFFNSSPIAQPNATTDLGTVLSNLGLRATGAAYPITTSGAVALSGASNAIRLTPRINTTASSATPAINVDTTDQFNITALATAITSMTSGLTGTPVDGQKLIIRIKDDGTARAITWGASFVSSGAAALPATTVISKTHLVGLIYDSVAAAWVCAASDVVGY